MDVPFDKKRWQEPIAPPINMGWGLPDNKARPRQAAPYLPKVPMHILWTDLVLPDAERVDA